MNWITLISQWATLAYDFIVQHWAIATVVGAGAVDFLMRVWKTQKPWDVMRLISAGLRAAAPAIHKIADLSVKLAELLDKILPNRVVAPAPVAVEAPAAEAPKEEPKP